MLVGIVSPCLLISAGAEPLIAGPAAEGFWLWTLLGRLHPMAVHFPVTLLCLAAFLEVVTLRNFNSRLRPGIDLLVAIGAGGAALAAGLGWLLAGQEDYGGDTLTLHRWTGVATAVLSLGAAALLYLIERRRLWPLVKVYRGLLLFTALSVTAAGHYGAALTHGEVYLTSVMPWSPDYEAGGGAQKNFSLVSLPAGGGQLNQDQQIELNVRVRAIFAHSCYSKLLEAWGTSYPGGHGLTLSSEGGEQFLFITDTDRNQVIKTDLKGKELLKIDYPREVRQYNHPGEFKPTETAINPANGDIYVADGYGMNFVIQYNAAGQYIRHWGGKGNTNETFDCCHGVLIDTRDARNPTLLITDRSNMRLKRFTLQGQYLNTIPVPGSFICRPVLKGKNLYAAVYRSSSQSYANSGYITILDAHDRVVSTPGGTEPRYVKNVLQEQQKDRSYMGFLHPHDVCVDGDENIYVPQWASGKTYPVKLERV